MNAQEHVVTTPAGGGEITPAPDGSAHLQAVSNTAEAAGVVERAKPDEAPAAPGSIAASARSAAAVRAMAGVAPVPLQTCVGICNSTRQPSGSHVMPPSVQPVVTSVIAASRLRVTGT